MGRRLSTSKTARLRRWLRNLRRTTVCVHLRPKTQKCPRCTTVSDRNTYVILPAHVETIHG